MQKGNRNLLIECWRIVFCIVILGFHLFSKMELEYFHAGYLGVEFFLILSGWAIYGSAQKILTKGKDGDSSKVCGKGVKNLFEEWLLYAKKRLIRLYPLYFCSMLLMLSVKLVTKEVALSGMLGYIKSCLAEFFMLQCSPLGNEVMISANWYVAVLFWGSLLWMALLLTIKKPAAALIAPAASLVIYGYYFRLIGKIDVIFSYHAFLRAFAGLGLGIFLAFMTESIRNKRAEGARWNGVSITLGSLILLGIAVYTNFGHRSRWDYLIIALSFAGIFFLLLSDSRFLQKYEEPIKKLAKATYPVYVFQMPVIELILYLTGH